MAKRILGLKRAESSVWLAWVIFSVLAAVAAMAVTFPLEMLRSTSYYTGVPKTMLPSSVLGVVEGAIIGTGQWLPRPRTGRCLSPLVTSWVH
jgi:hypothetical protein